MILHGFPMISCDFYPKNCPLISTLHPASLRIAPIAAHRSFEKALITHVVCQHSRVRREARNADGHVVVDFEDLLPEHRETMRG